MPMIRGIDFEPKSQAQAAARRPDGAFHAGADRGAPGAPVRYSAARTARPAYHMRGPKADCTGVQKTAGLSGRATPGSRGRGSAGTAGRSASPMLFQRLPQSDIIR
jgi:hypothetical protein